MMQDKSELINRGSATAKAGFDNEDFVIEEFNNWSDNLMPQQWLIAMSYNIKEIESVKAFKVKGHYKSDIQVEIKQKHLVDVQNIQVKLVSNSKGFNQVDKRYLSKYKSMWDMDDEVYRLLKHFTGEISPSIRAPKNSKRMFANEFSTEEQEILLDFFNKNKVMIISDVLRGRGTLSAEWVLVIQKRDSCRVKWAMEPISKVLNYFGNGPVSITSRGSFRVGRITIQRKGGDNGRDTANMLQFKINPAELIDSKHSSL